MLELSLGCRASDPSLKHSSLAWPGVSPGAPGHCLDSLGPFCFKTVVIIAYSIIILKAIIAHYQIYTLCEINGHPALHTVRMIEEKGVILPSFWREHLYKLIVWVCKSGQFRSRIFFRGEKQGN